MRKNKLKTVSLFSGCGGFDLGVEKAGHEIIWANDIFPAAAKTYIKNFPDVKFVCEDVRRVKNFPKADLMVGCYPCQGYSEGGSRKKFNETNFLYKEFLRAIRQVKPKFFISENVAGMEKLFNGWFLKAQLREYKKAGYRVSFKKLNVKDYGVPQERKRIFIVGIRNDLKRVYNFPEPSHGPAGKPYATIREAIWDFPRWPKGEYHEEDFHWYYLSRNRRRGWDEQSLCVTANPRHVSLHPMSKPLKRVGPDEWRLSPKSKYRRLSYKECAVLQTFPRDFKFEGTLRERYHQVGNAVPPLMSEKLVAALPI